MRPLPPETWKPIAVDTIVDVPFPVRDDWGRDIVDADMIGAEWTITGVPIELPLRVRYEDATFVLMTTSPYPTYWREHD